MSSSLATAGETGRMETGTLTPIVNTRTYVTQCFSEYSTGTSNSEKQKEYMIIQAAICIIL